MHRASRHSAKGACAHVPRSRCPHPRGSRRTRQVLPKALLWILRTHQSKPIPTFWIDHPYGEEEITLLEEELLPVLARLLQRIEEIDAELEAGFQAEFALLQAAGECEHEALIEHEALMQRWARRLASSWPWDRST